MRPLIRDFVRIASETLPLIEPIYEFGSLQVPGQESFADLRQYFRGKVYVGCDMTEGPGVDRILNLHNMDIPSESVGAALIMDTLEHVEFFREAMNEVYRILKPDGIVVISSVMNFMIHNYPNDYWRFTPEGFKSILKTFPFSVVDSVGEEAFPHTVIGVGFKTVRTGSVNREQFEKRMRVWRQLHNGTSSGNWKKYAKPFIPPIILDLYRKVQGTPAFLALNTRVHGKNGNIKRYRR
jgi:SAM-dependent methyltransferase